MFSRKMAIIAGLILLIAVNAIVLSVTAKHRQSISGFEKVAIFITAPFQEAFHWGVEGFRDLWRQYFFLVFTARENQSLKAELRTTLQENRRRLEAELANARLRKLLDFQEAVSHEMIAAEVVGKDPSPWFKALIVDKGASHGIRKGLPVVTPEGIVGQVIQTTPGHSKIMLIIDQNSAVDALIQRTRTRGIIEGEPGGGFNFRYVLRKEDVKVGDVVVSSGLDGVFPKGFDLGQVSGVVRPLSGMFQEVSVLPAVDFNKLEEVLILLSPPHREFMGFR